MWIKVFENIGSGRVGVFSFETSFFISWIFMIIFSLGEMYRNPIQEGFGIWFAGFGDSGFFVLEVFFLILKEATIQIYKKKNDFKALRYLNFRIAFTPRGEQPNPPLLDFYTFLLMKK